MSYPDPLYDPEDDMLEDPDPDREYEAAVDEALLAEQIQAEILMAQIDLDKLDEGLNRIGSEHAKKHKWRQTLGINASEEIKKSSNKLEWANWL